MKQRLVGAAVLVALAVIFLPMLIGGPESSNDAASVSTDIPDRGDRQLVTRDLPLAPALPAATNDAANAVVDENRVATVDMTDAPARVDALADDPSTAPATPSDSPAVTAPVDRAPSTPAAVASDSVASTPAAAASNTPTVASVAAAPTPAPVAATPNGNWAVNLGTYANAGNANALVAQMRGQKLAVYSESISLDGKPAQRVRLGPYAQRSQAESARLSALKLRGDLPTSVISLEGEGEAPAAKPAVAAGFAVQLGAFASQADANAMRGRARAAGFSSYVERVATDSGVLWRVRLGPELQRANAEKLKADAKNKLGVDGNVVAHP
ncbi:MAG TPA: SPOR domain-containing protein [Chiayiivirga sp.]|nr:SPOR domain-containing protein [Chiayiivirga sp.]